MAQPSGIVVGYIETTLKLKPLQSGRRVQGLGFKGLRCGVQDVKLPCGVCPVCLQGTGAAKRKSDRS